MTDNLIEAIARAIDPHSFRQHGLMVAHCLKSGDTPEDARRWADMTYGSYMADAMEEAQAALRAISDAGYAIVPKHPGKEILDAMARADPRERNQDFDHEKYLAAINAGKPRA